jgi:hypothetical protein
MTTLIAVYHNGLIITNEIGSYEFVEMKETFLLNGFLTLQNLVGLVRERLGWMNEGFEVRFKCRIDIWLSNGPRIKTMSPVYNERVDNTCRNHDEVKELVVEDVVHAASPPVGLDLSSVGTSSGAGHENVPELRPDTTTVVLSQLDDAPNTSSDALQRKRGRRHWSLV